MPKDLSNGINDAIIVEQLLPKRSFCFTRLYFIKNTVCQNTAKLVVE